MGVLPTAAPPTSPCTVLDVGTASPSCGGLEGSALGTGVPGRFLEQMAFYPGPEGRADGGLALVGRRGLMERPGRPIILPRPGHQPRRGGLWSTAQAGGNRRVGPSRWSGCHSPVRGSRDHWRPGRSTHPISHELCEPADLQDGPGGTWEPRKMLCLQQGCGSVPLEDPCGAPWLG
ncbi:PREDICTED: uncharacterized protein LOC105816424 isoform X2 [Propithecus coquereli]|uniref:uncharacterized protein LOC105816424 isoform X2 n=1 Tax=Propithecus coquereli TaxID=379532 RepID=UPI00063F45F2|nr:PREDICTED: uncharacterized protein LOC105816424 isoform X2 [Propithecus coquereli]